MPNWVSDQIIYALNTIKKSVSNSKILILGVAYKKNIDDLRESPAIVIMDNLINLGADVEFSDPFVNNLNQNNKIFESVDIDKDNLKSYDLVVLLTDHDDYDYDLIKENAKLILDTRGVYKNDKANVLRA